MPLYCLVSLMSGTSSNHGDMGRVSRAMEESGDETGNEEECEVAQRLGQVYKLVCAVAATLCPLMELINLSLS